jgi:hypothetical protein
LEKQATGHFFFTVGSLTGLNLGLGVAVGSPINIPLAAGGAPVTIAECVS